MRVFAGHEAEKHGITFSNSLVSPYSRWKKLTRRRRGR
jgi:hypothetical protein